MKLKKIAMLGMTLALSIGALAAGGSGKTEAVNHKRRPIPQTVQVIQVKRLR